MKDEIPPYDGTVETGSEPASGPVSSGSAVHIKDLHRVARGSGINFLGSMIRTFMNFVYALFLAAVLGPADIGLFFLGSTVIMLLSTVSLLGIDTGVVRFAALYDGEGDRARVRGTIMGALAITIPASILFGCLLFIFAGPIAERLFDKPELTVVLKVFSPYVPLFVIARIFNSGTQGLKYMRAQVYSRDFAEQLLKLGLSAIVLVSGVGLIRFIGANVTALALATALSLYYLLKMEPLFRSGLKRVYELRRLIFFSAPLAVSTLLSLLILWTDTLFLGYFRPSADVGIYSIAIRIATLGGLVLVSFNTIFSPLASDFYNRGEFDRLENLLQSVTKWVSAISFPIFAVLVLYAHEVLGLVGTDYSLGATAFMIVISGKLFDAVSGPVANMLIMSGRPRLVLLNNVVVFSIDVILCVILIPRYGMIGAAISSAVTLILFNIGVGSGVIFLLKLQPFSAGFFKLLSAGVAVTAVALGLKQVLPAPLDILFSAAVFILGYSLMAYLLAYEKSDAEVARELRARLTGNA